MDNIRFLTEILMSDEEYWCAMKQDEWAGGKIERSVWFISVTGFNRSMKRDDIKLCDLENLRSLNVDNIPLSQNYPPFQIGISMYNFIQGFPVKGKDARKFVIDAMSLDSKDIHAYKELLPKEELKPVENGL